MKNFSTDALRWLNNAQSAADSANFLANVKFSGITEDLTAPGTPWIYYGVRILMHMVSWHVYGFNHYIRGLMLVHVPHT